MKLIIEDDEGRKTVVPVVRDEITIGRQDGNTIKLTERNVSRKHARLWKDSGSLLIEDLGSYNGVRVNGDKIAGPTPIKEGDLIEIGDYDLGIQGKLEAGSSVPPSIKSAPAPKPAPAAPAKAAPAPAPTPSAPPPPAAPAPPPMLEASPTGAAGGATAIININNLMASAPVIEVRDLAKNEMPRLVGLAGAFRGKEFYLMRTEWKVGRTEENDMQVDHQSMSRQHGKFVMEPEGWKVYDNKSGNGIKVNGELYAAIAVKAGDSIEFGHVKFRFCAPGEKFSPPPEKVEGAPAAGGKPAPTTAELIAGASQKGPAKGAAAPAGKSKLPLILGGAGAVVVIIILAVVLGGGKKEVDAEGNPTGEAALKLAKAAEAKKDYKTASAMAEAAGDKAPSSYKSKMAAEAGGQEAAERLDAALAKGDGDAAMAAFEKCASESTHHCEKAKGKEDAVKAAYAKKHLEAARAAKGQDPTACTEEVGKVLSKDPNNAEAQQIQGECSPNKPVADRPPKPVNEGPSQASRDASATKLLSSAVAKVQAGDPGGGVSDFKACVAQKPSREILGRCWKNMGVAYSKAGDLPKAVQSLKTYLPFCGDDCDQIKAVIAKWGG